MHILKYGNPLITAIFSKKIKFLTFEEE